MDNFIARQPIFNKKRKVVAYELLFRDGFSNAFDFPDGNEASSQVIINSLTLFGMNVLTGGLKAFINITRDVLLQDYVQLFSPDQIVAEILEDVPQDAQVTAACARLKKAGFKIALDDVVASENRDELIAVSDIIKVDFLLTNHSEQRLLAKQFGADNKILLAEKVETYDDFVRAVDMGYELFQGYFFAKPEIISKQGIHTNEFNCLRLLKSIQQPNMDIKKIEEIIKHDVSLSYRLLRYINSAFFSWRVEISSIKQAIVLLGEQEFKKWAMLIAMSGMAHSKPTQLLITALIRARFLEEMAPHMGQRKNKNDLFLLGLFSVLDAVMDSSFKDILTEVPIAKEVAMALLGEECEYLNILRAVKCFEQGDWNGFFAIAGQYAITDDIVPDTYLSAVEWAHQSMAQVP